MTWYNYYSDDNFLIDSSNSDNTRTNRWNKNFIRVTCLDVSSINYIYIGGEKYEFFSDNETVIFEFTDIVRAYNSGHIIFETTTEIYDFYWAAVSGELFSPANEEFLPLVIPFKFTAVPPESGLALALPFYIAFDKTVNLYTNEEGESAVVELETTEPTSMNLIPIAVDYDLKYIGKQENNSSQFQFVNVDCDNEFILLEWVGRFGQKKSWWFRIEKEISSSDKRLSLQTLDNSHNVLKNKNIGLELSHKSADNATQRYLSDIVLSDEVYFYNGTENTSKSQVEVETNSFEIVRDKRDISLKINTYKYDTI